MTPQELDAILQRARELQAQQQGGVDQQAAEYAAAFKAQAAAAQQAAAQKAAADALAAQEAERQQMLTRDRTWGERAQDAGVSLAQGGVGLVQAAYGITNMATLGLLDRASGASGGFQFIGQQLQGLQSDPMQASKAAVDKAFARGVGQGAAALTDYPEVAVDYGVQSLPYLIPGAAVPRLAGAAAATQAAAAGLTGDAATAAITQAATRAGLVGSGALSGGMTNVDAINAAQGAGVSPGGAQLRGLGAGAAAALLTPAISKVTGASGLQARSALSLGGGQAAAGGATTRLGAIAGGAGVQAGDEALQGTLAEQIPVNLAGGKAWDADLGKAAVLGAVAAAPTGAGMGAITPLGAKPAQRVPDVQTLPPQWNEPPATVVTPEMKDAGRGATAQPWSPQYDDGDLTPEQKADIDRVRAERRARSAPTPDTIRSDTPTTQAVAGLKQEVQADLEQTLGQQVLRPSPFAASAAPVLDQAALAAQGIAPPAGAAQPAPQPAAPQQPINTQARTFDLFGQLQDTPTYQGVAAQQARAEAEAQAESMARSEAFSRRRQMGLDLSPAGEPFVVEGDGTARRPQYDLLGDLAAMRAPQPEATPQAQAQAVSRRQMGLDLQGATSDLPLYGGVDILPGLAPNPDVLVADAAGDLVPRSLDLFGQPTTPRAYQPEATPQAQAQAQAVSRRQMGLDMAPESPPLFVGPEGAASPLLLPGFARDQGTPPATVDQAALLQAGVLPPAFAGVVPAPAMPDVTQTLMTPDEHRRAIRDTVMRKAKLTSSQIGGVNMKTLFDDLQKMGVDPRSPQFSQVVGKMANERLLAVDAEGKTSQPLLRVAEAFAQPEPAPASQATRVWPSQAVAQAQQAQQSASEPPQRYIAAVNALTTAPDAEALDVVMSTIRSTPEYAALSVADRVGIDGQIAAAVERIHGAKFTLADGPAGGTTTGNGLTWRESELGKVYSSASGASIAVMEGAKYAPRNNSITEFVVPEELRGMGEGAKLLNQILAIYDRNDVSAAASSEPSVRAFYREGFRPISEPGASVARAIEMMKEDSSVTMVVPNPANPDIRYALGAQRTAIAEAVASAAKRLQAANVTTHSTVAALEAAVGFKVPSSVKGMYHAGRSHVVLENIADQSDLALTVAHERGHAGLDQVLGTSLRAATGRMWSNAAMRRSIKIKMAERPDVDRNVAAEEVLADMLASEQQLPSDVWSKLYTGVRTFIARLFGTKVPVSNQQINDLLTDVARVLRGAPAGSVRAELRNPELWLTDPQAAAAQNPKFAKAKEDTIEALSKAAREEGAVTPFMTLVRAAGKASADAARDTVDWLRSGGVSGTMVRNAMPLNQIASHYDKQFGGRIGVLSRLKTAKDARFNSLNAKKQQWGHAGQKISLVVAPSTFGGKHVTTTDFSINDLGRARMEYSRQHPAKNKLLDVVLSDGSFYKVFPDSAALADIDYEAVGYTKEEREAAAADIRKAWGSLDEQGRNIYRATQAVYEARWDQEYKAKTQELQRMGERLAPVNTAAAARMESLRAELAKAKHKMKEGPYSPLQRNGDFLVEARDADGKVLHFSGHDSRREALAAQAAIMRDLKEQGVTGATVGVDERGKYQWRLDNVSLAKMEQIHADVAQAVPAGASPEQRQQIINALSGSLVELYLQSLPPASFGNHAKNRKHVAGYDRDSARAFGSYTVKSARAIANTEFDGRINTALNDIGTFIDDQRRGTQFVITTDAGEQVFSNEQDAKAALQQVLTAGQAATLDERRPEGVVATDVGKLRQVFEGVRAQHAASLNTDRNKIADALTQGSYIWFLTSPSQMVMNATQTWMVALPRLAARYGGTKATAEVHKAMGQYFRSGRDMVGDDSVLLNSADPKQQLAGEVLTLLRERGPLDIGQAHDLSGIADGSAGELSPYWGKAMEVMSYAMHHSEVFNRQVTAAAAVQLELGRRGGAIPTKGTPEYAHLLESLYDTAFEAIDTTQFNYAQSNKPPVMQGPMGRLVFQFQTYRFHMLAMLAKDIRDAELGRAVRGLQPMNAAEAKEARSALTWLLAMQLGFTGTVGTVLAPFVFAIADMFRDEDDLTDSRTDWINYSGKLVSHGVLSGVIDTGRIASDSLIPFLGDRQYIDPNATSAEVISAYATKYLGPWVGFLSDIGTGAGALKDVAFGQAAVSEPQTRQELWRAMPKPMEDAAKALDGYMNGVQDRTGAIIMEPTAFGAVAQAFGLRSAEARDVAEQRGAYAKAMAVASDRKTRMLGRLANAYATGDMAGANEAMQELTVWNAKHPDLAARPQEIQQVLQSRIMRQMTADQYGVPMGRMPGPTIESVIGR